MSDQATLHVLWRIADSMKELIRVVQENAEVMKSFAEASQKEGEQCRTNET